MDKHEPKYFLREKMKPQASPITPRETYAVAPIEIWKTAALLFDKLCQSNFSAQDFYFYPRNGIDLPPDSVKLNIDIVEKRRTEILGKLAFDKENVEFINKLPDSIRFHVLQDVMTAAVAKGYTESGFYAVPILLTDIGMNRAYKEGISTTYQAALENIPLVDEKDISWDQVLEFRKDKQAIGRYRAFHPWISEALKGKSISEAVNIVGKKLDDYKWALKKHGINTRNGALKSLIDSKYLVGLAAGSSLASLFGGPVWAALIGGAITISKIGIFVSERKLELEDIKRNSEVALLYDIHKEFSNGK